MYILCSFPIKILGVQSHNVCRKFVEITEYHVLPRVCTPEGQITKLDFLDFLEFLLTILEKLPESFK
jgi:hypothetical protein